MGIDLQVIKYVRIRSNYKRSHYKNDFFIDNFFISNKKNGDM